MKHNWDISINFACILINTSRSVFLFFSSVRGKSDFESTQGFLYLSEETYICCSSTGMKAMNGWSLLQGQSCCWGLECAAFLCVCLGLRKDLRLTCSCLCCNSDFRAPVPRVQRQIHPPRNRNPEATGCRNTKQLR